MENVYYLKQFLWVRNLKRLSWMVLAWGLPDVVVKMSAEAIIIWRLDSWRICFHTGSHAYHLGAGCWQEASVHCSVDCFMRLFENAHDMTVWLLPEGVGCGNIRQDHDVFSLNLGSHALSFPQDSIAYQVSSMCERRLYKGVNIGRQGSLEPSRRLATTRTWALESQPHQLLATYLLSSVKWAYLHRRL